MIRMPLRWVVFTALSIFLAGILFTWICYEIARCRREAQKLRSWTQCPVCTFQYKIDPSQSVLHYAQSGGLNEHRWIKTDLSGFREFMVRRRVEADGARHHLGAAAFLILQVFAAEGALEGLLISRAAQIARASTQTPRA